MYISFIAMYVGIYVYLCIYIYLLYVCEDRENIMMAIVLNKVHVKNVPDILYDVFC